MNVPEPSTFQKKIGLGTWPSGTSFDKFRFQEVCKTAIDEGVGLIDTSGNYAGGLAEEALGELAAPIRSNGIIVATKAGNAQKANNLSKEAITSAVEGALRRLKVDRLDIFQMPAPDPSTHWTETAKQLCKLIDDGKIKNVGFCNYPESLAQMCTGTLDKDKRPLFRYRQQFLNIAARIQCATDNGRGWPHERVLMAYGVLGGGLVHDTELVSTKAKHYRNLLDVRKLAAIGIVAEEFGISPEDIAIEGLFHNTSAEWAIIGMSTPKQAVALLRGTGNRVPSAAWRRLRGILLKRVENELGHMGMGKKTQ